MAGTMAARSGAPPSSSTPATPEAAAAAPNIFGRRVGAVAAARESGVAPGAQPCWGSPPSTTDGRPSVGGRRRKPAHMGAAGQQIKTRTEKEMEERAEEHT
jgi:hypothetical protein